MRESIFVVIRIATETDPSSFGVGEAVHCLSELYTIKLEDKLRGIIHYSD